ncbi:MAG: S8/S53 family peptidase [Flavobacterium sp.]
MKNKITKLFLALLAITLGNNAQAQDQPMPDYVRKATNIEFLQNFSKEKANEFEVNYNKAVEIAREQGKPISGEKDGRYFSLVGYNVETGNLKYYSTSNNSAVASSLQTANAKPLHLKGITGTGMKVGVWDGGVGLPNHLAFTGGRYIVKDNTTGTNFHAAHVAGTVAGGLWSDQETLGFANTSQVYAYNWSNDLSEMAAAAAATVNPIFTSNHSYGLDFAGSSAPVSIFGQYDSEARDTDLLANNAVYYTIVIAAGNDRDKGFNPSQISGKDLLTQGGVSKNTVVVAATQGTENFSGITGPSSVISVGGVGPFIAGFSNYGPTDDFRIKPDISAKGVNVKSISDGTILSTLTISGTSMAAPAVTGVFTLWQQYHNQEFTKYMRSASVRALMAHTARETGPGVGPDFMFGWGLIDAAKGVEIMDQAKANTALFNEFDITNGASFEYVFPYNGVAPLVATIAWNDPAGTVTPSSTANLDLKKLVNDLDLRLVNTDTNQTYYPWSLDRKWAITSTSTSIALRNTDNARDNIEKIEPQNAVAGNYKIIVSHKGTLQGIQNYSLIISGAGGQMPATDGKASVESIALSNLIVYPNPVNSVLNISGDLNVLTGAQAQIFDISGKKIKDFSLNFDTDNTTVDVSGLQTGTYILSISKNGSKQSYKFIKK